MIAIVPERLIDIAKSLEYYTDFIFNNYDEFSKKFCHGHEDLYSVTYNSEWCKFYYVTFEGQHISDQIELIELVKWMNEIQEK